MEEFLRAQVGVLVNQVKQEIRDVFTECSNNDYPLRIDRNEMRHMCYGISGNEKVCDENINTLISCEAKGIYMEGKSILIVLELRLKIPVHEPELKASQLDFLAVPAKVTVMGITGNTEEIRAVENIIDGDRK